MVAVVVSAVAVVVSAAAVVVAVDAVAVISLVINDSMSPHSIQRFTRETNKNGKRAFMGKENARDAIKK